MGQLIKSPQNKKKTINEEPAQENDYVIFYKIIIQYYL